MRNRSADTRAAVFFLLPFLTVYGAFLLFPLIKGFWISLHKWNLLKAAIDPTSVEFVGFKNYIRIFWGKDMIWAPMAHPFWQGVALAGVVGCAIAYQRRKIEPRWLLAGVVIFALMYFVFGWMPGEDGRWYTRRFWPSVGNTLVFVAWTVPSVTLVSLLLAVLLNQEGRVAAVFRTIFFATTVLSVTVATLVWQLLLSPHDGPLSQGLELIGITPIAWLSSEGWSMASIVLVTVWWGIGISMMLFLAGLQEISSEIYDAARIDGIGRFRTFWSITIPNLMRTITLVMVLGIVAHFQVFGQVHLMTQGGPGDSTQVLVRLIYETGFRDNHLGRATAMSVFLLVTMMIFSILQIMFARGVTK
jgi:multiple sugar transport system permease protein